MKKTYLLFRIVQLIWSALVCVLMFIAGRDSAEKATESLFIIGAVAMGTILFIALQPLLKQHETSSKARMILVIGYILVFTANLKSLNDRLNLFSVCCLILSVAGMLTYAITDESISAHLNNKGAAKTVFFLLLFLSLVCNVGGNLTIIYSSEIAVYEKIINIIMIVVIIVANIILLLFKNQSTGIIHFCASIISGLLLESPFMYVLLLLIITELITINGKYSIYTLN